MLFLQILKQLREELRRLKHNVTGMHSYRRTEWSMKVSIGGSVSLIITRYDCCYCWAYVFIGEKRVVHIGSRPWRPDWGGFTKHSDARPNYIYGANEQ